MLYASFLHKGAIYTAFIVVVLSCNGAQRVAADSVDERRGVVSSSVQRVKSVSEDNGKYPVSENVYNRPAPYLSISEQLDYYSGRSFFKNPWVRAPATTTARDGLGPLFNANSCQACHIKNGRGSVRHEGLLLRLSQRVADRYRPDSTYGGQLQHRAVAGTRVEGQFDIQWRQYNIMLADGSRVCLRAPRFIIRNWALGDPDPQTRWSARIAPPVIGLGLLEAIAERDILANAARQHMGAYKVSGRPSWVKDRTDGRKRLGRFGWKALQPDVRQQSAHAFAEDLGLTSSLYPRATCTSKQRHCLQQAGIGDQPEVKDVIMDAVTFYVSNNAVPAVRNSQSAAFKRGQAQFHAIGCGQCHRPHWRTEPTALQPAQDIWPYTDLLLHDMGDGLAAPTGEGDVSGREWRTPPLWGIGLASFINPQTGFLHDGRARNLLEAILWHGGEARGSRQRVRLLTTREREDLLFFLRSL